jgi:hypothetical protein
MLSPCLVHFPDLQPRVVMYAGDAMPRPGDELISGWIVTRHNAAEQAASHEDYDYEIWVTPKP